MTELLHAVDVPLGIVTNGEHWMLVFAPRGETTGFASWYASLWVEEPITFRAFCSLFSVRRFFGVAENETIQSLLTESSKDQQEVTNQLGYQVRKAVEVLIQSLDRIDLDSGRKLLKGISEKQLYEAALTVMMRLVFLFSAEERGLLLLGDPLYDQNYAVSTLSEHLRDLADQHGEEILERRCDAWCRLLATFRAVYGGIEHEAMRLPPYGGTLFDPDRYPFLEGHKKNWGWQNTLVEPLKIDNRTVLHLLEALQILRVKVPGSGPAEARRISFRALDIEQIGHVYEGLLDHTAKRAKEPILGLTGAKGKELEIPLSELETHKCAGTEALATFLHERTKRSKETLIRALSGEKPFDKDRLLIACGNDRMLFDRVKTFVHLLRSDTFDYPVVINTESVYVTLGTARRESGTHYTPRALTEPIVQHTLEPLVYSGPAEGKPKEEWQLKSAKEILNLKVCDMTMGSGAFLVQACRYLAERLVEAWEDAEGENPGNLMITPDGDFSHGALNERFIPTDPAERLAIARRYVVDRCLFGVDINPMAVEMAKLSLWLITMQKDRPFTFLDHALKCGDSLVGISNLKQIETFSFDGKAEVLDFFLKPIKDEIKSAQSIREELEHLPSNTFQDIQLKKGKNASANEHIARLRFVADLLTCAEWEGGPSSEENRRDNFLRVIKSFDTDPWTVQEAQSREYKAKADVKSTFHWPLEFPEIFDRGGFDALIGNPPFMGGLKLETAFGRRWRAFIVRYLAKGLRGIRGTADLCAYFFRRAGELLNIFGGLGLLATNTISQGDSCSVGLEALVNEGLVIRRALRSNKWPGTANLEVAQIWIQRGNWAGPVILDKKLTNEITPFLTEKSEVSGNPYRLAANVDKAFEGSITLGTGFIIDFNEREMLLEKNIKNAEVIFPYLNGMDINQRYDQSHSRWVINFLNWPLSHETARKGYKGSVAADYPDCLSIIEERVKPKRIILEPKNSWNKKAKSQWWLFGQYRWAMTKAINGIKTALVRSRVSNLNSIAMVKTGIVYSDALIVFATDSFAWFALLQTTPHTEWISIYSSTMRKDVRYTPSKCFETFPFPINFNSIEGIGKNYYEFRRQIMLDRKEGLTNIYNRFHSANEQAEDIRKLRELHIEMDNAVSKAYGWNDFDFNYRFQQTDQGIRYTVSKEMRGAILNRLLQLNHQRCAEEVAQGLHEKNNKPKKNKNNKTKVSRQLRLFE